MSVSPEPQPNGARSAASLLTSTPMTLLPGELPLPDEGSSVEEVRLHPTRVIRNLSEQQKYQAFSINHHKSSFLGLSPSEYINSVAEEDARFSFRQFFVDFLSHQFFPFSLPLFLLVEGKTAAKNRFFLPGIGGISTFVFQLVVFTLWLVLIGLLLWEQPVDVSSIEILIFALMFTSRNLIIGLKYAYFSESYLQELRTVHSKEVLKKQVDLLIGSWGDPELEFLHEEIERSSKFAKTDLSISHFHHNDKEAVDTNLHLAFELEKFKNARERKRCSNFFNADVLALQLLKDGSRFAKGRTKLAFLAGFFHLAAPIIVKVAQGQPPFGFTPLGMAGNIINAIMGSLFFSNLVGFIIIGTIDFQRSFDVNHSLNQLITTGYKSKTLTRGMTKREMKEVKAITLDLHVPENLVQFFRVRHVIKETGRLQRRRLLSYASFFFIYAIALLGYMFVTMITAPADNDVLLYTSVSLDIVIVLICLLGLAIPAARNNQEEARQAANLSLLAVDIQSELSESDLAPTNIELGHTKQLQNTLKLCQTILRAVEIDNRLRPAKVLGFEGSGLIRSLFTAVASVLVVIFNALTRQAALQ